MLEVLDMMNRIMKEKIESVLDRVSAPESDLSVAQLGLVKKSSL